MASASALSVLGTKRAGAAVPAAPVAKTGTAKNVYFGETLSDPYRWMENPHDPDWLPYLKAQNDHARAVLDAIPGRAGLAGRVQALSGDTALTSKVQRAAGKLFYQQRPAGADNFKLFVREAGRDRVLVDPTAMGGTTGHVSLDWWEASPDGTHLAYGTSPNGSEDSTLRVLATADARDLPERIGNTQYSRPQWLDDGTGFFYTQLTGAVGSPERFLDAQARFHRLGTDPASDAVLMKRGMDPHVAYDRIQTPTLLTVRGASHVALALSDVRPEFRLLLASIADVLAGHARWVPVAEFADEVTDADLHDGALYLLVNKGSPLGRIVRTPAATPSLASAETVVPESKLVIEGIARAQDGLYLQMMDGGVSRLRRLDPAGHVSDVSLPFDGTISALAATPTEPGVLMDYTGWLTPADVWSVSAAGAASPTGLTPKPAIDVSGYETHRGFAAAKDGTQIPFSLIYRKGLKHDGRTPAWISAYGSYGVPAYTPQLRRPRAGAGGCRLRRRLRQRARRRRVRTAVAQGRPARQQAEHLARPDRRLRAAVRRWMDGQGAVGDRRAFGRRHHHGPRDDRTAGPVCRRDRRRRLVQPAALRGGAGGLHRGAGVGCHLRRERLPRAARDRQLPALEGRRGLSGGAADDGGDGFARGPVPRGEDDGAAAEGELVRQACAVAGGLRRGTRRRVHARPAGSGGGGYLCVSALAHGVAGYQPK